MPQWKGHHPQLDFLWFVGMWAYELAHVNLCNLLHTVCLFFLFFLLNICITLLGVMQEAAAARTKTSLTYWLTACHGKTCALSNNTPIKVYFCCTWNLSGLKSKQRDFIFRSVCTNFALRYAWVKPSTFLLLHAVQNVAFVFIMHNTIQNKTVSFI